MGSFTLLMVRARLWTLSRGNHEAALDLRRVASMGTALLLTVDGKLRRSRLYRPVEAFNAAKDDYISPNDAASERMGVAGCNRARSP